MRVALNRLQILRTTPVAVLVVVAATLVSVASLVPGTASRLALDLGHYHASDLAAGRWWRLPGSALLSQSWPQLLWTATAGLFVFVLLESSVGSLRAATVLAAGHGVPTLAVAGWAYGCADHAVLHAADFGTSCLIMAAGAAVAVLRRSWLLAAALLVMMTGDVLINSTMTVMEHLMSIAVGVWLVTVPVSRTAAVPRIGARAAAGLCDAMLVARPVPPVVR